MKHFISILFLILPAICICQKDKKEITDEEIKKAYISLPKVDGKYEFSEVVQLDSTFTKDALYKNSKLFFANVFESAKDVLQYDDREEGKIIGKGDFKITEFQTGLLAGMGETRFIHFTIEITCKDGKYKYRLYDISCDCTRTPGGIRYDANLDEAYSQIQKSHGLKLFKKLFFNTVSGLKSTVDQIRDFMGKKAASTDF